MTDIERRFVTFITVILVFIGGFILGFTLSNRIHQNNIRELEKKAYRLEIQMLELEKQQNVISGLEYLLDRSFQNMQNLRYQLERLFSSGPEESFFTDEQSESDNNTSR